VYKFSLLLLVFLFIEVKAESIDPTRPFGHEVLLGGKLVSNEALVLQTIVEQEESQRVVISGKLLNIGDQIGEYKLIKISTNFVLLTSPERDLKLSLFSSVVTKLK